MIPIVTFLAPSFWTNLPSRVVHKPKTGLSARSELIQAPNSPLRYFAEYSLVLKTLQTRNNPGNRGHANLAVLNNIFFQSWVARVWCMIFQWYYILHSNLVMPWTVLHIFLLHLLQFSVNFFAPTVAIFVFTPATQTWLSRDRELAMCSEFQMSCACQLQTMLLLPNSSCLMTRALHPSRKIHDGVALFFLIRSRISSPDGGRGPSGGYTTYERWK